MDNLKEPIEGHLGEECRRERHLQQANGALPAQPLAIQLAPLLDPFGRERTGIGASTV
jgi:hypothetical protein